MKYLAAALVINLVAMAWLWLLYRRFVRTTDQRFEHVSDYAFDIYLTTRKIVNALVSQTDPATALASEVDRPNV